MSEEWYVYKDQKRMGPFTRKQLNDQALTGAFLPEDRVWSEETSGWIPARKVDGLFPGAATPPPPPPPDDSPCSARSASQAHTSVPAAGTATVPGESPSPVPPTVSAEESSALSVGQYFLFMLLCSIPVVNLILLLIWSFGGGAHPARKNLSRAILIFGLISGVITLAVYMVMLILNR